MARVRPVGNPRQPRDAPATLRSAWRASARVTSWSNCSRSISRTTLATRSSAADPHAPAQGLDDCALARLPSQPSTATLTNRLITTAIPGPPLRYVKSAPMNTSVKSDDQRTKARQCSRLFGPRDEPRGIDDLPAPGIDDGDAFAQVDARAQQACARLPLADVSHRRHTEQPRRKPLFAHRRAAARDQLKQAAGPENVQIVRVGMIAIAEPLTAWRIAHPAILDARLPVRVEHDRSLGARQCAYHRLVPDEQRDEQHGGSRVKRRRQSAR